MYLPTRPFFVALALLAFMAAPAVAGKSRLETLVIPISEALESAEKGDRFVVEGVVQGSEDSRIFRIRDDSGEMYLRIPEFLRREHGVPQRHERIRVAGRWTNAYLEKDIKGMHVQDLERIGRDTGRGAEASDAASAVERPQPSNAATDGAPPAAPDRQVIAPRTPADWKARLGDARQRVLRAERAAQEANASFARAVHASGSEEAVDPAIVSRRQQANEELAAARLAIPKLVAGARSAGVDPKILEIYQAATIKR